MAETSKLTRYAFVLDAENKPLSPTKEAKAWFLIRKGRATLVSKFPMVIQLNRVVPKEDVCKDEIHCGIDDGGLHTGISIVQKCQSRNKVLFKGTIEHRKDVKKKMGIRRGYRRNRRSQKRYRKCRFNNRKSSKRSGRAAPSILQKKQATVRVASQLRKWVNITHYSLEDVAIDIRALTDGYKPYRWEYQCPNRLDENLRKAAILRDGCKCMVCGKSKCVLEAHHIKPKRSDGPDTIHNLATLCHSCHEKITGHEEDYMGYFYGLLEGQGPFGLNYASHVMIGKTWLQGQLVGLGKLSLTTGGDTANKRIDWDIPKTHANDAVCITGLKPDTVNLVDWVIKPIRRKSKARTAETCGFRHRDLVAYTYRNGETYQGYVTALYPGIHALNFQSPEKHCKKVNAEKCRMVWRYDKIYWFDNSIS